MFLSDRGTVKTIVVRPKKRENTGKIPPAREWKRSGQKTLNPANETELAPGRLKFGGGSFGGSKKSIYNGIKNEKGKTCRGCYRRKKKKRNPTIPRTKDEKSLGGKGRGGEMKEEWMAALTHNQQKGDIDPVKAWNGFSCQKRPSIWQDCISVGEKGLGGLKTNSKRGGKKRNRRKEKCLHDCEWKQGSDNSKSEKKRRGPTTRPMKFAARILEYSTGFPGTKTPIWDDKETAGGTAYETTNAHCLVETPAPEEELERLFDGEKDHQESPIEAAVH